MKPLFIIAFFTIFFLKGYSQEHVTVEQCQNWAVLQSSANVKIELNEQLLKVKINDASSHLYPSLEIVGMASYVSQMPSLPSSFGVEASAKDQYRAGIELYQVLFDGGKVFFNRQYERLKNKSEIDKLKISINAIKENVITIYLNLLILDKQNNILSNVEKTLDEQLEQMKARFKEGVINRSQLAQLEVEQLKIRQQKGELLAQKELLINSLSILTCKDLSNCIFDIPNLDEEEDVSSDSYRLEYDIFDTEIKGLDYQRKLHYTSTLPQISLVGIGGWGRTTFNFFSNEYGWFYFAGIIMKIPVINWAKTAGVGNIIKLQKAILESQKSDYEKSNKIAINEKVNEISIIEKLLILDNEIAEKYKGLTAAYRAQLSNGTITAYDFIRQQNDEIQSLISREMHTIQLYKAKYELRTLRGIQ